MPRPIVTRPGRLAPAPSPRSMACAVLLVLQALPFRLSAQENDAASGNAPESGRWRVLRAPAGEDTADGAGATDAILSLGYVSGSRVGAASGITRHEPERTWPGWNLYCSGHGPVAILMDMDGEVLHRWSFPYAGALPDRPQVHRNENAEFWRRVHLFPNGDLLAIFEGLGLVKIDARSRLLWARPNNAHHEMAVRPDGDIWVLTRTAARYEGGDGHSRLILEDFVSVLDADGNERRRVSVLDAFRGTEWEALPDSVGGKWDILHTNTLHPLWGRIADRVPAFRAGDVLISMRHLDTIAVLSMESGRITWAHRGAFRLQHDPRVLDNGNLLLFDNGAKDEESSAVLEIDPVTGAVVWSYRGTERDPLYSRTCGTAARLPNGNTLVVESDGGRALELAPDDDIVWEFYNPNVGGDEGQYIATLFEMVRLSYDFPIDWAEPPGEGE